MSTGREPHGGRQPEPGETREERPAPGFGELLAANVKIVGWALVLALAAWALWRGLRQLFPEVRWLQ